MSNQVLERGNPTPSGIAATAGRHAWADVAKGVCILLVVLHHLVHKQLDLVVPVDHGHWQDVWADVTWVLKPVRMPLFFLVSGFFAAGAIRRPWRDARRRIATSAWLYAVWLPLLTLFLMVETLMPANRIQSWPELAGQLLLPATSLWFIHAMLAYFVLLRAVRRLPRGVVLAVAAAACGSVSLWGLEENNRIAFLSHFVYFAAGALYPEVVRRTARADLPLKRLLLGYVLATVAMSFVRLPLSLEILALSTLSLPLGVSVARRLQATALGGPLAWLGRNTLQVYVLHLFVIGALLHVPARLGADAGTFELVAVVVWPLVGTLLVTGACLTVHRLLVAAGLGTLFSAPKLLAGR